MANNAKVMGSIKDFLLKMKAMDADIPADLAEDALAMTEAVKDALCEDEETVEEKKVKVEEKTEDEEAEVEKKIETKVEDAMVKVLRKYGLIKDGCMEALDEMEEKLGTEDSDEGDVTVDPEKMNDSAKRQLLRETKPVIASVKDNAQRKALSDAFAKALNLTSGGSGSYGDIMEATKRNAMDEMNKKMQAPQATSDYDFGMQIAQKYNPTYMKED